MDIRAEVLKRDTAQTYISEALQTPEVSQYVKRCLYAKPLYMIIGVTSCKQLLISNTRTRESAFSAGFDAATVAAAAEAGAGLSTGKKASPGTDLEVQEECDFAYRVRKFQYSRFRRGFKTGKDVTDGAVFGREDDTREVPLTSAEAEAIYDEVAVFDDFDSDDDEIDSHDGMVLQASGDI